MSFAVVRLEYRIRMMQKRIVRLEDIVTTLLTEVQSTGKLSPELAARLLAEKSAINATNGPPQ